MERTQASPTQTKTILVLDDSENLLELMSLTIEMICGYKAVTTRSLGEIQALGQDLHLCDLAILDINLGPNEPHGVDVYRWLRRNDFTGKIFFLTGHARSYPLVMEAEQLGDTTVLCKPLLPSTLTRILRDQYGDR